MRTIKVQQLSREAFNQFGTYYDMMDPQGANLGNFYQDHLLDPVVGGVPMAFSALIGRRTDKMVVKKSEYHNYTGEVIIPLDGDVIAYVAPPSKVPVPEQTQAFLIPKGTVIRLEVGVWHMGPFPAGDQDVHMMLALPQRTYKNDCYVVEYDEKDWIEITK
jgi:ureidoglycolate lyase